VKINMLEPKPLRVFLCHASEDKPVVRELFERLDNENWIDPWLDTEKLLVGQDWQIAIKEAVEESDAVIIFLSKHSVSKESFVQKEMRYAVEKAQEKPDNTLFIFPIRLEECSVPDSLKKLQWADYFFPVEDESYMKLLLALEVRYEQILESQEKKQISETKQVSETKNNLLSIDKLSADYNFKEKKDVEDSPNTFLGTNFFHKPWSYLFFWILIWGIVYLWQIRLLGGFALSIIYVFVDIILFSIGLLVWLFFFSQFVLPVHTFRERQRIFDR